MTKYSIKKLTLYRLRFWIGYISLAIALLGILVFAMLHVPGGLTSAEQLSALKSSAIDFSHPSSLLVANMPYRVLQNISITAFGLSSFSVKLPSIITAYIAAIALIFLFRRWFKPNVSVITGSIMLTSASFIIVAQSGTPAVMHIFWPIMLLLTAGIALQYRKYNKPLLVLLGLLAGLSLFTPLSIYMLLALGLAGLLHPHVRFALRRLVSRNEIAVLAILFIICCIPVIYTAWHNPTSAKVLLLGAGSSFDLLSNLKVLALEFADITSWSSDTTGVFAPVFDISTIILAVIGTIVLYGRRHSVQSYVLGIWILLLVPILLINPDSPEELFVPVSLLVAYGISYILNYWYGLFPKNPYARTLGLVPLVILVGSLVFTGAMRYFYTFSYDPVFANKPSYDIELIAKELKDHAYDGQVILVSKNEEALYKLFVSSNHLNARVTTNTLLLHSKSSTPFIVASKASTPVKKGLIPERVVTSSTAQDTADRFYIYKNMAK